MDINSWPLPIPQFDDVINSFATLYDEASDALKPVAPVGEAIYDSFVDMGKVVHDGAAVAGDTIYNGFINMGKGAYEDIVDMGNAIYNGVVDIGKAASDEIDLPMRLLSEARKNGKLDVLRRFYGIPQPVDFFRAQGISDEALEKYLLAKTRFIAQRIPGLGKNSQENTARLLNTGIQGLLRPTETVDLLTKHMGGKNEREVFSEFAPSQQGEDDDRIFILTYPMGTGHSAAWYKGQTVDMFPDIDLNEFLSNPSLKDAMGLTLCSVKRKADLANGELHAGDQDFEVLSLTTKSLERYYREKLGYSAAKARKMVEELPMRMQEIQDRKKNFKGWSFSTTEVSANCADAVRYFLGLPDDFARLYDLKTTPTSPIILRDKLTESMIDDQKTPYACLITRDLYDKTTGAYVAQKQGPDIPVMEEKTEEIDGDSKTQVVPEHDSKDEQTEVEESSTGKKTAKRVRQIENHEGVDEFFKALANNGEGWQAGEGEEAERLLAAKRAALGRSSTKTYYGHRQGGVDDAIIQLDTQTRSKVATRANGTQSKKS